MTKISRPRPKQQFSEANRRPWLLDEGGISRRTYYRRKAAARNGVRSPQDRRSPVEQSLAQNSGQVISASELETT